MKVEVKVKMTPGDVRKLVEGTRLADIYDGWLKNMVALGYPKEEVEPLVASEILKAVQEMGKTKKR